MPDFLTDRPVFRVKALPEGKGTESIDLSDRVLSFEYEDHETKADKLTLKVNNWDLSQFDDPIWKKGTILEVTWGYPGRMAPIRRAIVQKIKGARQLTIEAHGMAMVMHKIKRSRVWANMTLAEIARKIAGEYGSIFGADASGTTSDNIKIDTELDKKVPHRVQTSETDASFLSRLAKRHGLQFYVDSQGLHFKERNLRQAPIRAYMWYNGDRKVGDRSEAEWIDFDIENDVTARAGSITKKGFDPLAKKVISHKADNASTKRDGLAPVIEIIDPRTGASTLQKRSAEEHVEHSTESTSAGVKSHAQGEYRQTQHMTVKLNFTCIGDPDVLAKRVVEFKGIGKRLSGRYYIKEVTHSIDGSGGFTIKGKAHTDGHGGYGNNNAKSKAALNHKDAAKEEVIEKIDKRTGQSSLEFRKKGEEGHH